LSLSGQQFNEMLFNFIGEENSISESPSVSIIEADDLWINIVMYRPIARQRSQHTCGQK
jgi:hypothetical protein